MSPRTRRVVTIAAHVLKVVVFAILLAAAVTLFDDQKLVDQLGRLSTGTIVGFFVLMFANGMVVALRWLWICRRQLALQGVNWGFLLRLNLFAEFVVIWLPSSLVAEGVRLWRMKKRTGNLQLSAASIVVDRVFGMLALIVCIVPFLPAMKGAEQMALSPLQLALVLCGSTALGIVAITMVRRYQGSLVLLQRVSKVLERIRILSPALLASCMGLVFIVLAQGLVYQELTDMSWLQVVPLVLIPHLGRAIPISLFGFGAVEGGTLLLGGILGIDNATLLLVAALVVLSKYLNSTIGVVWEIAVEGWTGLSDAFRSAAKNSQSGGDEPSSVPADT